MSGQYIPYGVHQVQFCCQEYVDGGMSSTASPSTTDAHLDAAYAGMYMVTGVVSFNTLYPTTDWAAATFAEPLHQAWLEISDSGGGIVIAQYAACYASWPAGHMTFATPVPIGAGGQVRVYFENADIQMGSIAADVPSVFLEPESYLAMYPISTIEQSIATCTGGG